MNRQFQRSPSTIRLWGLVITCSITLLIHSNSLAAGILDWLHTNNNKQWQSWEGYKRTFISEDGRVIDFSTADLRTVSEGQAYALFLSLVANDPVTFEKLLRWTEKNLSQGDLGKHLPAWLWGKTPESWQVIDANTASDADLWLIYALMEAGQHWCKPKYTELGQRLANLVLSEQILHISGLGLSLLPGRYGFIQADGRIKLNPSYVPPFLLARLANVFNTQPFWAKLYLSSQTLLLNSHMNGLYPDWIEYQHGQVLHSEPIGDYDAIRVYLWLSFTPDTDPIYHSLLHQVQPFIQHVLKTGYVPEHWNLETKQFSENKGPSGFQYALAPLLKRLQHHLLPLPQLPKPNETEAWKRYGYYDGLLSLFAQAHLSERFQMADNGRLILKWQRGGQCDQ